MLGIENLAYRADGRRAAALMRQHHVGALVVTAASADAVEAVGMVTDRDLAIEALARGFDPKETQIGRLTDSKLATLPAGASLDDAIEAMKKQGVRRLLVRGDGDHLRGIVSLDDVLDALAHEVSEVAQAVRRGIERETAERPALAGMDVGAVRIPAA